MKNGALQGKIYSADMGKIRIGAITIFIAVAGFIFIATGVRALYFAPDVEVQVPPESVGIEVAARDSSEPISDPSRIRIPTIDVNAVVQKVGVNDKGNMASPSNFTDVAWYKYGPVPGAQGSAVIAGHLNNALGLDGVFADLKNLKTGDEISISREDGTEGRFIVTEIRSYPFDEVPTEAIFDPSGPGRLALITCDGDWLQNLKTYDRRLIVYAQANTLDLETNL